MLRLRDTYAQIYFCTVTIFHEDTFAWVCIFFILISFFISFKILIYLVFTIAVTSNPYT